MLPGRRVARDLVDLSMQRQCFFLQEQVQVGGREFVAQEVLDLGRILDHALLIVELAHRLVAPPLRSQDLQLDLLDLYRQHLRLVEPVVGTPRPSPPRSCQSQRSWTRMSAYRLHDPGDRIEQCRELSGRSAPA